jgi:Ca2+-binding RTX toxin-like protein
LNATVTLNDPDGVNSSTLVRTWQAETGPGIWTDVGTGTSFTPGQAQVGQALRVVVTFDDLGAAPAHESVTSAPTDPVIDVNQLPVGVPILLDALSASFPQEGTTITVSTSGITDNDGMVGAPFTYQWQQRVGTGSFTNITGATGASFTPAQAQVGRRLRALVSYTDNGGALEGPIATAETVNVVGDLFVGTAAADTFAGTAGRDRASGLGGNDTLRGAAADDVISGDTGDDALNGGTGNDTFRVAPGDGFDGIVGGTGIDTIEAQASGTAIGLSSLASVEAITANGFSNVTVAGSAAANTFNFGAVALTGVGAIDGGAGADTITGTAFADTILGGSGADRLNGGRGDDTIAGGTDNDALNGGAGFDVFRFEAGFGADTITGFDANPGAGGQDRLDLVALGVTAADFGARVVLATSADGLNTVITVDGVSTITVLAVRPGAAANQISITDFVLSP